MKNLLIYNRPDRRFSRESWVLAELQIDNSLDLGWKREDILLFTNFPYEYNGVRSVVTPDLSYKPDRTNKIPAIVYLLDNGLLPDDLIWYHDFDAYQDNPMDVDLGTADLGLTRYGYKSQWNCGSFFFKLSAEDLFHFWNSQITPRNRADEKALTDITNQHLMPKNRYISLNLTYNFGQRLHEWQDQMDRVEIPIKVLHFHPYYKYYRADKQNLQIFMYGQNRLNRPLMSDRLIKIFQSHGIK